MKLKVGDIIKESGFGLFLITKEIDPNTNQTISPHLGRAVFEKEEFISAIPRPSFIYEKQIQNVTLATDDDVVSELTNESFSEVIDGVSVDLYSQNKAIALSDGESFIYLDESLLKKILNKFSQL